MIRDGGGGGVELKVEVGGSDVPTDDEVGGGSSQEAVPEILPVTLTRSFIAITPPLAISLSLSLRLSILPSSSLYPLPHAMPRADSA